VDRASQIPRINFSEIPNSPVINDVTYRVMLMLSMLHGYTNVIVDIETAFLHGNLAKDEEIYMECPPGMNEKGNKILILKKTIYGLVQAAKAFYKKLCKVLRKIGFTGGYADPCLLSKKGKKGTVHVALYVDDCYCCGDLPEIECVIEDLKKNGFTLKIEKEMTDYLSCRIEFSSARDKAWIGQPHLLKKIREKFGSLVEKLPKYRTPGSPHIGIRRPTAEDPEVSKEDHSIYRSGVGCFFT
jgi:hypothetical protein